MMRRVNDSDAREIFDDWKIEIPDDWDGFDLPEPLTPNERQILDAMLTLNASPATPRTAEEIIKTALYQADTKKAFKKLRSLGLLESKEGRGGGYWLTPHGQAIAKKLISRVSHTD